MSIRDEIADEISGVVTGEGYYSMTIGMHAAREAADLILASPVIRRIQAEAIREFVDKFHSTSRLSGLMLREWGYQAATHIEKGE